MSVEYLLSEFWKKIELYYGIEYSENKNKAIFGIIKTRLTDLGINSIEQYLNLFITDQFHEEEYRFWATQLTINETYFFRDEGQWEMIRKTIIPNILRENASQKTFRAISLGSSSGEEPYTLAMILQHYFEGLPDWKVTIDATDIQQEMIERAHLGRYSEKSIRALPREISDGYIKSVSKNIYQLSDDIRQMVNFFYYNLIDLPKGLPSEHYDLVICRNVIIYFSQERAIDVLKKIVSLLSPAGYLAIGHSEGHLTNNLDLVPIFSDNSVLYKKRERKTENKSSLEPWRGYTLSMIKEKYDVSSKHASEAEKESYRAHYPVFPCQFPDALVDQAVQHIEKQEFHIAKQRLETAVKQLPLYTPTYYLLGILYQILNDPDRALRQFERVVYLDPKHILGYFQCALLYQQKGNCAAAVKFYKNILTLTHEYDKDYIIDKQCDLSVGFIQMICSNFLTNTTEYAVAL